MKKEIDLPGHSGSHERRLNHDGALGAHAGSLPLARRVRAFLRRGEEGQALVEIALTLPALLAIITAIFAFAIAFSNQLTLTNAVGAAGQYLQTIRGNATDPCTQALTALTQAAPNLNPAKIAMTLSLNGAAQNCQTAAATKNAKGFQGDTITVTATYPYVLPIMNFTGVGWNLTATVTEYSY